MNYLLKNTELQTNFNFNNVAIVHKRPRQLGLLTILDAFIEYRQFTMKESCKIDLAACKKQEEIEEGLMKAVSILDEIIATIRASKNKADAKLNLCEKFDFTEVQAEAIVTLQLYKLTNTDILAVEEHLEYLRNEIERLNGIINDPEKLNKAIKEDLKQIKKEYATERKTHISDEVTDIKVDKEALIKEEDVIVCLTNDGYLKRVSKKSYNPEEEPSLKPGDYILNLFETNTLDKLIVITNLGNYLFIPVSEVPTSKWKDLGKHINNIVNISPEERPVASFILNDITKNEELIIFTKNGLVKKSVLDHFSVTRYNKPMCAIKLKENDEVVSASINKESVLILTKNRYLKFASNEIPTSGVKTSGVKAINLKDDEVTFASSLDDSEYVTIFTNNRTAKRVKLELLDLSKRANRGNQIIKKNKTVKYEVMDALLTDAKDILVLKDGEKLNEIKNSEINITDQSSNGGKVKFRYEKVFKKYELVTFKKEENKDDEELPKLNEESYKELTIDDFIEEFKL